MLDCVQVSYKFSLFIGVPGAQAPSKSINLNLLKLQIAALHVCFVVEKSVHSHA